MKRPGKCIGKRSYAYKTEAERAVIRIYLTKRRWNKVYECPTCLDFHLTTAKPEKELRDFCYLKRKIFLANRHKFKDRQKYVHRCENRWINLRLGKIEKGTPPLPKKKPTYMLPIAKQKEVLATISNPVYKSWYRRFIEWMV